MRGTMASSAKELDGVCVDTVAIAGVENYPHDIRRVVAIQDGAGGLIHGWVDLDRSYSTVLPSSAWATGNRAELAG